MSTITYIVQIFLDFDRPTLVLKPQWVCDRIEFFETFTLPSLLSQSFQDFRIFMICGQRNAEITSAHKWHPKVEVCYDNSERKYYEMGSDYVSVTRLDSDDLMHRDAMQEVADNQIQSDQRECLIWRKNHQWNIPNRFISRHWRPAPPFFTHIFPRAIYKNWTAFCAQHFLQHGSAGGRLPDTVELSPGKICVTKHFGNISKICRGLDTPILTASEMAELKVTRTGIITDRDEMVRILSDFTVDEKWIPRTS